MGFLLGMFWETSILFSTVVVPIFVPTNSGPYFCSGQSVLYGLAESLCHMPETNEVSGGPARLTKDKAPRLSSKHVAALRHPHMLIPELSGTNPPRADAC